MAKFSNFTTRGSSSNVLEHISGVCDGRTVTSLNGDITFPTTSIQGLSTSHAAVNGSAISYQPPNNTKTVIWRTWWSVYYVDYDFLFHVKPQIGDGAGSESFTDMMYYRFSDFDYSYSSYSRPLNNYNLDVAIQITGSDDIAKAKVATWSIPRTLRLTAREYSSSYDCEFSELVWWDGTSTNIHNTVPRNMYIELISLS